MNPQKNCSYSLVPSKNTDKEWNLQMVAVDDNTHNVKMEDSLKIELPDIEEKYYKCSKSIIDPAVGQDCNTPLVTVKKEIESDDGSNENHINIDMSIIKEEVLDIDEIADYTWQEDVSRETNVDANCEEDKNFLVIDEESQELKDVQLKVSLKRRRRDRSKDKEKPKHWCSICKCKQESAYALAVHRRNLHLSAARYRCSYCPNVFFHHSNRKKHELTHLGPLPRHNCPMCTRSFARKYGLEAHIRSVHTGERPYVCEDCGMTFTRDGCYRLHKYIHTGERPYTCTICPRAFTSKSDLNRHIRVHTGEKPFTCDKCLRTFRLRGQLNRHLKSHTGEKPLACGLCPKMFRIGTNVALHRGSHIVNAAVLKIHKCKICQREFARKGNLKAHLDRHSATRSIKCAYCGLAFKNKSDLSKHENIHTREKVFFCDTCGKSFLRKVRLRYHVKLHLIPKIPKEPTICKICGKEFKFPSQLKIHQKRKKCKENLKWLKKGE